ncbi:hypothetical protein MCETOYE15_01252 [Candidatus Nanopelagicaceae bacterium]
MTPKKPDWFELTEAGDSYAGIKKVNKKLPIATLALAGAVILGGSVFATANNEPSAVAETPTASQSIAAVQSSTSNNSISSTTPTAKSSSGMSALPVPKVTAAPQRGEGGEGRERDHEDREDD